jgi:hypothetical protein
VTRTSVLMLVGLVTVIILGMIIYRQMVNGGDSSLKTENLVGEFEKIVTTTYENSERIKQATLEALVKLPYPDGALSAWGDVHFAVSALYLDRAVAPFRDIDSQRKEANKRIQLLAEKHPIQMEPKPDRSDQPDFYFSLPVYAKIYYLFNSGSPYFPGRITKDTEDVMKEQMWRWVYERSHVEEASLERIWEVYDSENHDLVHKIPYYLFSAVLKDDDEYAKRTYADGHSPEEHFDAWNEYFKAWLKERALHGMFVELGSSTYQKYSYAAILALVDVAPDEEVKQRAKMLLDLAFIEEVQISFDGIRGGGRSRVKSFYTTGATCIAHILGILFGGGMVSKTQEFTPTL